MTLEKQDAELFYELWFPLLDFVNQKYRVCPDTGTIDRSRGVDAADAKKIADYLCPTHRCFRNTLPSQGLRDSLTFVMQNHRGQDI